MGLMTILKEVRIFKSLNSDLFVLNLKLSNQLSLEVIVNVSRMTKAYSKMHYSITVGGAHPPNSLLPIRPFKHRLLYRALPLHEILDLALIYVEFHIFASFAGF